MAKGFKSGGRKAGTKNRKTVLRKQALASTEIGPIEFMLGVMRANEADPRLRLDAAKGAAQFLHPKPSTSKPGIDAKLIGSSATASDVTPLTNNEWLLQLQAERAAESAAGTYRPDGLTDQYIREVTRRIQKGLGDRLTSYVPGEVQRTPEEKERLDELSDRTVKGWIEDYKRDRQVLERKREVEPQILLPKAKKEWGGLT
jgi:hypothetical protein